MQISFYGVRGSVPTPGPATVRYGGNTSCVHVRLADGTDLVLDAGTGLRGLGRRLAGLDRPVHVLLTHDHWDHIQGLPFFEPIFEAERPIRICQGVRSPDGDRDVGVIEQLNGHNFPVPRAGLPARLEYVADRDRFFEGPHFRVLRKPLNHPGGGQAYLIEADGARVAYVTDNELLPPYQAETSWEAWVAFVHGVDVLIHDAQYTEGDMPRRHGWGHSLVSQVCDLARAASVDTLVLFHHDPDRTDLQLDRIQADCDALFRGPGRQRPTRVLCAWEGLTLDVGRGGRPSEGPRLSRRETAAS